MIYWRLSFEDQRLIQEFSKVPWAGLKIALGVVSAVMFYVFGVRGLYIFTADHQQTVVDMYALIPSLLIPSLVACVISFIPGVGERMRSVFSDWWEKNFVGYTMYLAGTLHRQVDDSTQRYTLTIVSRLERMPVEVPTLIIPLGGWFARPRVHSLPVFTPHDNW